MVMLLTVVIAETRIHAIARVHASIFRFLTVFEFFDDNHKEQQKQKALRDNLETDPTQPTLNIQNETN